MILEEFGRRDQVCPVGFNAPQVLRPMGVRGLEWPDDLRRRRLGGRLPLDKLEKRGAAQTEVPHPRQVPLAQLDHRAARAGWANQSPPPPPPESPPPPPESPPPPPPASPPPP